MNAPAAVADGLRLLNARVLAALLPLALAGCVSVEGMNHAARTVTVLHDTLLLNLTPSEAVRERAEKACAAFETGSGPPVLLNAEVVFAGDAVRYTYFCPLLGTPDPDPPMPVLRT